MAEVVGNQVDGESMVSSEDEADIVVVIAEEVNSVVVVEVNIVVAVAVVSHIVNILSLILN